MLRRALTLCPAARHAGLRAPRVAAAQRPLLARWLSSQPTSTAGATSYDSAPSGTVSEGPAVIDAPRDDAFLILESPRYQRMINMIMMQGKKEIARKHLWEAITMIRDGGQDAQEVFHGALDNVQPMMEMKSFRSGPVPYPLNPRRAEGQAMKWIVAAARGKKGAPKRFAFSRRLANELLSAYQNKGSAVQKKEQVHRDAVTNQAAAHFRWRASSASPPGSIDMNRGRQTMGRRDVKRLQASMSPRKAAKTANAEGVEVNLAAAEAAQAEAAADFAKRA